MSQNPRCKDAYLEWHAYILAGILRVAYAVRRELKDKHKREWCVRVGTSRHVAVALYTNSIMHARANINYCGFNIGRRRWPWPTTSWAKHVKRGENPVNEIAILPITWEIPQRSDTKTCESSIMCLSCFGKIIHIRKKLFCMKKKNRSIKTETL